MVKDHLEAFETIQRICIEALHPQKLPPIAFKPIGRPKGSVKRKRTEGSTPQRLEAIRAAVMSFIPLYKYEWTETGRPSAMRVREITGLSDISHWEIQIACPGYTRRKAEVRFLDRKFLGQKQGNWFFEDIRDGDPITLNLYTRDIDEARRLRDVYLKTGQWDFRSPQGPPPRMN